MRTQETTAQTDLSPLQEGSSWASSIKEQVKQWQGKQTVQASHRCQALAQQQQRN